MKLLDQYVVRSFLRAYVYCIAGFLSIWLIFDVSDNISNFVEQHVPFPRIVQYYFTQAPQILVAVVLPISLLLALLFSLGRMSRANEIVSMLAVGMSIPRLLASLFVVGFLIVVASTGLNYTLAPHAETARKTFLLNAFGARDPVLEGQIFRNRTDLRTWFIQNFRPGENTFNNVQVLQQDENDNIATNYIAARALYEPAAKSWELENVKIVRYDHAGNITQEEMRPSLVMKQWNETPFRLSSANVRAESLGVPELREYLRYNSDFPPTLLAPFYTHLQYRLALPWTCFVVVVIAAPLGIGYSRRGMLSSVATCIILVFLMYFLTHLFLALGEGDRIPPWAAAWIPNILFGGIGGYLLYLRATNREGLGVARLFAPRKPV